MPHLCGVIAITKGKGKKGGVKETNGFIITRQAKEISAGPGFSPCLGHGCKFAWPTGPTAQVHEDPVGAVHRQTEVGQALFL